MASNTIFIYIPIDAKETKDILFGHYSILQTSEELHLWGMAGAHGVS
jgi:hypothetical protein